MGNVAFDIIDNKNENSAVIYDFVSRKPVNGNPAKDNGTYDNRAGKKCEVYAFRTDEEIKAMIDVYNKHIENKCKMFHQYYFRQIHSIQNLILLL